MDFLIPIDSKAFSLARTALRYPQTQNEAFFAANYVSNGYKYPHFIESAKRNNKNVLLHQKSPISSVEITRPENNKHVCL